MIRQCNWGADWGQSTTGLYVGTWLTNIKWIKDAQGSGNVEWDVYAGKKGDLGGGFTYDVGGLYYFYPENGLPTNANTFELYGKVGYGPAYFKYSHALTNLFGAPNSKHSQYYDIGADFEVGAGVTLGTHVGYQKVKGAPSQASYTDWRVGVRKTFTQLAGVTLGVDYIGTDVKDGVVLTPDGKNAGKGGVLFSLSKTF